jgi:nitroimidazol reductase NimA-like FMN-containing flavoprotein (pyridoxamine 5'-phosphate oxidase superfamily)
MEEINLKTEILDFLRSQYIMSVAVCEDNKPSSSILLYYIDDELNIYFATHADSIKAKKLKINPLISLSVWEHKKMLIQADGEVSEVVEEDAKLNIIDKLAESSSKGDNFWPPLLRIKGGEYTVFKIKPIWLRRLDLKTDTMTQTDSPFSEIKLN